MRIRVDSRNYPGVGMLPALLHLDGRAIAVAEVLDQWPGEGHCYFKLRDDADNLYIIRFNEKQVEWTLVLFQSARGQTKPF
jgi:hypothetical protein